MLIKKLIAEAYTGEKIVLIENEFARSPSTAGFLKELRRADQRDELRFICCSLVGDFADALKKCSSSSSPTASSSSPRASAS